MRETTVTIQRPEGTALSGGTGIRVQVDQTSDQERVLAMQAYEWRGADLYKVYTLDWNPGALIARGDLLVDERFTDEETGQYFRYRVVGRPKNQDRFNQTMLCEVVVGQ